MSLHEALYYKKEGSAGENVRCLLCPHVCLVMPLRYGLCRARKNEKGKLYSMVYGQMVSMNLDPIEKKPLYHFYPGSKILSCGTTGCNFRCSFCQNWEISQAEAGAVPSQALSAEEAIAQAKQLDSIGIAYTYNEPLMNYEWVKDTAVLVKANGLKNVLVSNGYINPEPWRELIPLLDAANIDVKSFRDEFYQQQCGGHLAPVLKSVESMVRAGKHVELTTLLIPKLNDSDREIEELVNWISSIDKNIPLHFSRYFPQYRLSLPSTERETLIRAYGIAKKKLNYVYLGNVPAGEYDSTKCSKCGNILIERAGYETNVKGLKNGVCASCGEKTNIPQKGYTSQGQKKQ